MPLCLPLSLRLPLTAAEAPKEVRQGCGRSVAVNWQLRGRRRRDVGETQPTWTVSIYVSVAVAVSISVSVAVSVSVRARSRTPECRQRHPALSSRLTPVLDLARAVPPALPCLWRDVSPPTASPPPCTGAQDFKTGENECEIKRLIQCVCVCVCVSLSLSVCV